MERLKVGSSSYILCVVQARLSSSRFPGKVMKTLTAGHTVISTLLNRLTKSEMISKIVVAIPNNKANSPLAEYVRQLEFEIFLGDEFDVQSRFLEISKSYSPDWIVRITGDCPMIDPKLVDRVISLAIETESEYCSNIDPPTFPDGLDVEVFRPAALSKVRDLGPLARDLEHVTWSLRESGHFTTANLAADRDMSHLRWVVDVPEDLQRLRESLPINYMEAGWEELADTRLGFQEFGESRNAGLTMSAGQKVWQRAKGVIPGGSMLLSKRPELFLPSQWPTYYSKAKGIEVWDLDGNRFLDFSTMSVGACSLGYGNEQVDNSAKLAIEEGVMSSLNSPAEVSLAEKLVELHSWASMVRFARTGGEANAIATRIARAHTGRDKVAICGYHGWHDWYLAANLDTDSNLDGHLLPGLQPRGVPRGLVGSSVPFAYNDLDELRGLLKTGEFAAVQMEVSRNYGPENGFLEGVRELCSEYGVVLIFDECTSGFRETFGGLHLKFGVYPDLAMFGKALGNGYAITAVIGVEDVMQAAQTSFISSTFWTERIGPLAALATIEEMYRQKSWEKLPKAGAAIKKMWQDSFTKYGIEFVITGLDALPSFVLPYNHWPVLKTLLTQELLDRGYLSTGGFYPSTMHSDSHIEIYREAFMEAIAVVSANFEPERAASLLRGPVADIGFKRLN